MLSRGILHSSVNRWYGACMIERKNAEVLLCTCDQCRHSWTTLSEPKRCANCKTPAWNRDKSPAGRPAKQPLDRTPINRPIKRSRVKEPAVIEAIQSNYTDTGSYGLNPASQPVPETLRSSQAYKSKEKKTLRAPLFKKESASRRKTGRSGMCPCGAFFMVDGITSCPRCKRC